MDEDEKDDGDDDDGSNVGAAAVADGRCALNAGRSADGDVPFRSFPSAAVAVVVEFEHWNMTKDEVAGGVHALEQPDVAVGGGDQKWN